MRLDVGSGCVCDQDSERTKAKALASEVEVLRVNAGSMCVHPCRPRKVNYDEYEGIRPFHGLHTRKHYRNTATVLIPVI